MKKDHRKTVNGLQGEVREREREVRELGEDLRVCREDLERERELVDELKRDVEERDRTVLEFTTKSSTMWDLNSKLQSQVDDYTSKLADLTLQWESAQREVEKMQREAMESEMIRRKLHNIVQELKGNIRVFCRVRPILPSDVAPAMRVQGGGAHNVVTKNDLESAKEVLGANMTFPDRVNRKEISLVSTSESATGLERKEVHTFSFDRVSVCFHLSAFLLTHPFRSLNQNQRRAKSLRRSPSSLRAVLTDTTSAYSHMAKRARANPLQWKVDQ